MINWKPRLFFNIDIIIVPISEEVSFRNDVTLNAKSHGGKKTSIGRY